MEWHADADRRHRRGERQRQCPVCRLWLWAHEYGDGWEQATRIPRGRPATAVSLLTSPLSTAAVSPATAFGLSGEQLKQSTAVSLLTSPLSTASAAPQTIVSLIYSAATLRKLDRNGLERAARRLAQFDLERGGGKGYGLASAEWRALGSGGRAEYREFARGVIAAYLAPQPPFGGRL